MISGMTTKGNRAHSGLRLRTCGGAVTARHTRLLQFDDNVIVESNTADMGGGICIVDCEEGSSFMSPSLQLIRNRALNGGGGGIYWQGLSDREEPRVMGRRNGTLQENLVYRQNIALYGPDTATNPFTWHVPEPSALSEGADPKPASARLYTAQTLGFR